LRRAASFAIPVPTLLTYPSEIAAAGLILFLAYSLRAITGFGSALVAVPLLSLFLPLQFVVPWIVALDVAAAFVLTGASWRNREVDWGEIRWLLPPASLGILLGLLLLVELPQRALALGLGGLIILFGLRYLLGLHGERPVSRIWALPAGALGGAIGSLFATGGPPSVIYLSHRLRDKSRLRATLSGLFLIEGGLRLLAFVAAALLVQPGMLKALLLGAPIMGLALYAGHHVHISLSQRRVLQLVGVLLAASGCALIWRWL
jgi:uncharacterized membrane protein YfcA